MHTMSTLSPQRSKWHWKTKKKVECWQTTLKYPRDNKEYVFVAHFGRSFCFQHRAQTIPLIHACIESILFILILETELECLNHLKKTKERKKNEISFIFYAFLP